MPLLFKFYKEIRQVVVYTREHVGFHSEAASSRHRRDSKDFVIILPALSERETLDIKFPNIAKED